MSQEKLVSVIIPLYNCEDRILRCVSSVLNQTYKNIEVIVIDDGSTDNSLEVLRNGISDPRLQIYTQENHGVSYTRNRGIDIALSNDTDGWITFVDSDDYIDSNTFSDSLNYTDKNSYDLIHYSFKKVEESGSLIYDYSDNVVRTINQKEAFYLFMSGLIKLKSVSCNWLVMITCGLYRKKIILDNKIRFDREIRNGEDAYFSIQYLSQCNHIKMVNKAFYTWWTKANSLSSTTKNSLYNFVNGLRIICPALMVQIQKFSDQNLDNLYASYIISNFNFFLKRASICNLNYKDIDCNFKKFLLQSDVLNFIYMKHLFEPHEKIARLMLKSKSTFITFFIIKMMRLINGYWRIK